MSQLEFDIRPPQESDFDHWYVLWQGYLRFYQSEQSPVCRFGDTAVDRFVRSEQALPERVGNLG